MEVVVPPELDRLQEHLGAFEASFANAGRLVQSLNSEQIAALQRAVEEHLIPQPAYQAIAVDEPGGAERVAVWYHNINVSLAGKVDLWKALTILFGLVDVLSLVITIAQAREQEKQLA